MPIGTPSVPYRLPGSQLERWVDIYTRLGAERILFLGQEVNDGVDFSSFQPETSKFDCGGDINNLSSGDFGINPLFTN